MRLVDRLPVSALGLVLIAMVAFCVSQQSFVLLVLAGSLATLSWYVTEGPRGRCLPRWVQNVLLAALIGYFLFEWTRLTDLTETMGVLGRFVLWLTLVKLYGRKGSRDYAQIIALSAVLVMTGTLQSVELAFAVLVFLYAAFALYTVLVYQLYAARERTRDERARSVAEATSGPAAADPIAIAMAPPPQPVFGRSLTWNFRSVALLAIVLGAILSVVVFVIFPRDLGDARRSQRFGGRQSGYSEEVQLFTNDRVTDSRREVFTVQWSDRTGERMRFAEPLHLRGSVLNRYDPRENRWFRTRERRNARMLKTIGSEFVPLTATPVDERFQTYFQRVTMRSLASELVFSEYAPIAIACAESRNFEIDPSTLMIRDIGGGRLGRYWSYTLKVQPFPSEATVEALVGDSDPPLRQVRFSVPAVVAEAERLEAEIRPSGVPTREEVASDPALRWPRNRGLARAFADYLRSPRFSYSSDLSDFRRVRDEDPITSFLTRYHFGHCEYFASSLVALCQSVGIESRLVTGYLAIEYDEGTQQYIVRESNAHAWAEVRVGEFAWLTLDPTPGDTLDSFRERQRSWADRFRFIYDRLEFLWNSQVVSFDSGAQATIADRVSSAWQRRGKEFLDSTLARLRAWNESLWLGPAGYLWLGIVAFAVVLAILAAVSVTRRRRRLRAATGLVGAKAGAGRILRRVGFYLDALDLLAEHELAKPTWQPPLAFTEVLRAEHPEVADAFDRIARLYYRIRFEREGRATGVGRRRGAILVQELARALRSR